MFDPDGNPIMAQISPVVSGEKRLGFAANKFQLSFPVTVETLAITIYTVSLRDSMSINKWVTSIDFIFFVIVYFKVTKLQFSRSSFLQPA